MLGQSLTQTQIQRMRDCTLTNRRAGSVQQRNKWEYNEMCVNTRDEMEERTRWVGWMQESR
jgi:hypothetical protein